MLVFGDALRHEDAAAKLEAVRTALLEATAQAPGWRRHAALVAALVEAGELVQGVADAAFHAAGEVDRASAAVDAATALLMAVARRCVLSWDTGGAGPGNDLPEAAIAACAAALPHDRLAIKEPEGYAYYALYPESYLEAARLLPADGTWQVIGLRSIGSSLAAMVAAALGAAAPITLRPVGHPFARRIAADPALLDAEAGRYAIVDEGPGLSGSSIAAVVAWLADAGVAPGRIHVVASHGRGPGPQASADVRTAWESVHVHVACFERTILNAGSSGHRLDRWVAELLGPLDGPLREVSGGAWRELHHWPGDLPPAHPWQERRKFIARRGGEPWLVKFAGVGRRGTRQLGRARALAAAGFTAEPAGLCHGFLVERWRDDLAPAPFALPASWQSRQRPLTRIGDYLAFRASAFPAAPDSGASLAQLHAMARHNSEEAFGPELAAAWDAGGLAPEAVAALAPRVHRVETDNRMHGWEWLGDADGSLLKTDAIDHHAGHDLVGCQDIAWDVVGAAVELGLDDIEEAALAERVAGLSSRRADAALRSFLRPCYLAYQLGYWSEARAACAGAGEAARIGVAVERYARELRRTLAAGQPAGGPAQPVVRA